MVADSVAEAGLTPLQYGVLPCLNKLAGEPGIDQTELAGRLGVDRTNAGMLIDQLEGKELVERRVSGADRRARLLYLTSKGEKLYEQLRPVNLAANERILAPLAPKERELLLSLLVRVIEGNRLHARPGAGRRKWGSGKSDAKG
jgi:DNA-binding MarR family transcriptional regulator